MSKRRLPTKVLEMSGAFKKNPKRAAERENEPKPDGELGPPPADFLKEDSLQSSRWLEAWNYLIGLVPEGVLTRMDHAHVALTAKAKVRADISQNSRDAVVYEKFLSKMGYNPSDRSRVAATKQKPAAEDDEWEEFAPNRRAASGR